MRPRPSPARNAKPWAFILRLYEEQGPAIFDQRHGSLNTWLRQRGRAVLHLFGSKYSSDNLRTALEGVLGNHRLGESRTRLVIPAWHPMLERDAAEQRHCLCPRCRVLLDCGRLGCAGRDPERRISAHGVRSHAAD